MESYGTLKRREISDAGSMDGTWGRFANWNNPAPQRETLYDFTSTRSLE